MKNSTSHPFDWAILNSRHAIKDEWLSLRADTCRLPNGRVIESYYVLEYGTWVSVVALTSNLDVVLVRQYRHGIQRTILELPGGSAEADDPTPLAAIKRELLEETGYTSDSFVETGQICPNPASHNNLLHCFLATNVMQVNIPQPDATEQLEVVLMPLDAVVQLASRGGLLQALQVSTLFFTLAYLGRLH